MNSLASDRFWPNVVAGLGGCWIWTGTQSDGYGRFRPGDGTYVRAHRWAYEALVEPIPDGLTLDHLRDRCASKLCVNPDHLEPVTRGENSARAQRAKTHCPKGHEYTAENTHIRERDGRRYRECRTCLKAFDQRRDRRVRA